MTEKLNEQGLSTYQRPLFIESASTQENEPITWRDYDTPEGLNALAMSGEVGPHTNVTERAERLIKVMNKLAHRNKLFGLGTKGHDPDDNMELIERYAGGLPIVLDFSQKKVTRLENEALGLFWAASDIEKLRGKGLIGTNRMTTLFAADWRDFRHDYGHPKEHKDLIKFRRTQEKFLPLDHPLREENRLAKYKKREKDQDAEAA